MKLTKKVYAGRTEQRNDFIIGIAIFIGLNILLFILSSLASVLLGVISLNFTDSADALVVLASIVFNCILPFLINLGLWVFFLLTRSWIALGMLAGFGILLVAAVVLGILATVSCLTQINNSGFTP